MELLTTNERAAGAGKIAFWILGAAVFLFPLVLIPTPAFPFNPFKIVLLSVLLAASCALFALAAFRKGGVSIPRSTVFWAVILLPIVYAFCAYFSQNSFLSFIGDGSDSNTVFFVVLCALLMASISIITSTRREARILLTTVFISLSIIALFQILEIAVGSNLFGMQVFSSPSMNIVGKWNDFGIVMGLFAMLSMVAIDIGRVKKFALAAAALGLVVSLALLTVVNLDAAWVMACAGAVLVGLITIVSKPTSDPMAPSVKRVPFASVVVLIVSALCIAWGNQISAPISNHFGISELEVRPGLTTTINIAKSTYHESAKTTLLGTGPGTFVTQWIKYKPSEVNATQFWTLDFAGGAGIVPTAFITSGVIGGLVWALIIALLLFLVVRNGFAKNTDLSSRAITVAAGIGALYILGTSVLYLSGQVPLLLAFGLIGVALASERAGSLHEYMLALKGGSVLSAMAASTIIATLFVSSFSIAWFASTRFISSYYVGLALATPKTDPVKAEGYAKKALTQYRSDTTLRLLSSIKLTQAQAVTIETPNKPATADQTARFQSAFADSVTYALDAVKVNPQNYLNNQLLGQLYEALLPLKVEGAYQNAKKNYDQAITLNPTNPGLYLAEARIEGQGGTEDNFRKAIQMAFTLKPNFTEAALLVVQAEIARKNLDGAIIAAQVAVQTAPDNPGILFELGVLQYSKGDFGAARDALEKSIKAQPDYANAKYFLGLTYYYLQRIPDAIALFQDIQKSNPDNAEVKLILGNLSAGKDPFTSAVPPITSTPETRGTPPINE